MELGGALLALSFAKKRVVEKRVKSRTNHIRVLLQISQRFEIEIGLPLFIAPECKPMVQWLNTRGGHIWISTSIPRFIKQQCNRIRCNLHAVGSLFCSEFSGV